MRREIQRGLAILAGVAMFAHAREALAYCRTTTCDPTTDRCAIGEDGCVRGGAPVGWRTLPIPYRFSSSGTSKLDEAAAREAVRRAFDAWQNVQCGGQRTSLRFVEESDLRRDKGPTAARASEPFGIFFRDESWTHDDDDESLALTNQTYGKLDGFLDYADIEINTAENAFATSDGEPGIDLQAVLTHEIGHYIGLAHSKEPDSIMVARYCQSGERCAAGHTDALRGLGADDVQAVCALYPPSGIAGVRWQGPGPGSCAAAPGAGQNGAPAALAAALAVALASHARRRRALVRR